MLISVSFKIFICKMANGNMVVPTSLSCQGTNELYVEDAKNSISSPYMSVVICVVLMVYKVLLQTLTLD